jgi:hypothetical protein
MSYWIKRIALKDGEVVTERELRDDENRFDGAVPVVGDLVDVECRGRKFKAKVVSGNWPGRVHAPDSVVPLRVAEVGLQEDTPLRVPSRKPLTDSSQFGPELKK